MFKTQFYSFSGALWRHSFIYFFFKIPFCDNLEKKGFTQSIQSFFFSPAFLFALHSEYLNQILAWAASTSYHIPAAWLWSRILPEKAQEGHRSGRWLWTASVCSRRSRSLLTCWHTWPVPVSRFPTGPPWIKKNGKMKTKLTEHSIFFFPRQIRLKETLNPEDVFGWCAGTSQLKV